MKKIVIKGHKIVGGIIEGEAIVSEKPITFVGGVDPYTGILTEKRHPLENRKLAGKILVYPTGKGSTGTSYRIYDMAVRKTAPIGIINQQADPITTIGAIMGDIPLIDQLEKNVLEIIEDGDHVIINADEGYIEIHKQDS